jgi:hypothetical protein
MSRREYQYKSEKFGDELIYVDQDGEDCTAIVATTGEPYARLPCKIKGKTPIEGWFYLKWWSENDDLVRQLVAANILETRDDGIVVVSPLVNTCEARLVLKPQD